MGTQSKDRSGVPSLIATAFQLANARYGELAATWVGVSARIGGLLPHSLLMVSIQRDGQLDLVLRCMEDDFTPPDPSAPKVDFELHYHKILAELWIGSMYETLRLLIERKLAPSDELTALAYEFKLLRIPLEKHEIADDRKLTGPLTLYRTPEKNDGSDEYQYSKGDLARSHIMPFGVSDRGSAMWHVVDLKAGTSRWIERRLLSERIVALWGDKTRAA